MRTAGRLPSLERDRVVEEAARHGAGDEPSQSVTTRALREGSTSMSRPVSKSKMPATSSVGWVVLATKNDLSSNTTAADRRWPVVEAAYRKLATLRREGTGGLRDRPGGRPG